LRAIDPSKPSSDISIAASDPFRSRHIGPDQSELDYMLEAIGAATVDDLMEQTVPDAIRQLDQLKLGTALEQADALAQLREIAGRNHEMVSLIGMGYHGTMTPPAIRRIVMENPGWVHRLHAVSARDLSGPSRSTVELPNHGDRTQRNGSRERVAAR